MGFAETILVESSLCTGCRTCELACGFRKNKQMDPSGSSILVRRDDSAGAVEVKILADCDVCKDRAVPLCVEVCAPRALQLGRKARCG